MIQVSKLSKIIVCSLVGVLTVINPIISSHSALATNIVDTRSTQQDFCARLKNINSYLDNQINQRVDVVNIARGNMSSKLISQSAAIDNERSSNRTKWDNDRVDQYEKLYAKATTNIQKEAIDSYKATIETAVAKRRAQMDIALTDYRMALETIITTKQSSIDMVIDTYKSSVQNAEAKAQSSCETGLESSKVRENFKNDLQTASTNLRTGKNGIDSIDSRISELTQANQTAQEAALMEFEANLTQAGDKLRLVLNQ